jgi:hypothetical protein
MEPSSSQAGNACTWSPVPSSDAQAYNILNLTTAMEILSLATNGTSLLHPPTPHRRHWKDWILWRYTNEKYNSILTNKNSIAFKS